MTEDNFFYHVKRTVSYCKYLITCLDREKENKNDIYFRFSLDLDFARSCLEERGKGYLEARDKRRIIYYRHELNLLEESAKQKMEALK